MLVPILETLVSIGLFHVLGAKNFRNLEIIKNEMASSEKVLFQSTGSEVPSAGKLSTLLSMYIRTYLLLIPQYF